ncbi:pathogenicity locus [Methanoplanus sp. FWC-SCC4]|uniref:Pathogenicity locus n=1 Tax=Methanochimaera problematica TaxID=2609417 RepID=A0AA97F9W8_9EURY|nr:helix-hairpin-helix domain-containing protein [Methanoplanus sp. FWC-SCC4]WOF15262.1 pathogenicity locus [Methanoplanus sp. FWC-SCC4]
MKSATDELIRIPGVGNSIAGDLINLGLFSVEDLKGKNPEEMYARLCFLKGGRVDRCMLYVFRCAVYFAENEESIDEGNYDPRLLCWWKWKD